VTLSVIVGLVFDEKIDERAEKEILSRVILADYRWLLSIVHPDEHGERYWHNWKKSTGGRV